MMKQWTVEEVKDRLPDVKVQFQVNGKGRGIKTGLIRGRQMSFAQVSVYLPTSEAWFTFQAAWSEIAHCLNNNSSLRV